MTKEEFAAKLNGRQYMSEITDAESKEAKDSGLLVVFGYSDDNVELRGVIDDEIGAYDGTRLRILDGRIVPEIDRDDAETLRKYGVLEGLKKAYEDAPEIEALWCESSEYSWTFKTELPHATFDVMEDDGKFCRGIVIQL